MSKKKLILYIFLVTIIFSAFSVKSQENTLSISDALEKALANNYGIIISKSEIDIASINNTWGTAGRYPTVGFSVTSANSQELLNKTTSNIISGGIGINWTIFNGFSVNITKDKLEKLEGLSKGRSAIVIEGTIQDIIMSYYNILLQKERLKVLSTVMQLSKDRYYYEQTRYEIGGSGTYNVLLAKNIYLDDKASYLNQEVIVRLWAFTDEFNSDTTDYVLGDLLDKMMANNQTLQNQYVNLLLQQDESKLQRSALYPRLSLAAGVDNSYAWINPDALPETYTEALTPYGNVSLSYDIFSAGNRKRAINVAKINEQITQVETDEMKHSLTNQLYNEYDIYNVRKTLLNVANESKDAAELNLQIADEKFKSGAINSFNYRDIQLNYLNSALNQLQSIYNLIYANTTLTRLTGGFLDEE
jgi:outer membrane protein